MRRPSYQGAWAARRCELQNLASLQSRRVWAAWRAGHVRRACAECNPRGGLALHSDLDCCVSGLEVSLENVLGGFERAGVALTEAVPRHRCGIERQLGLGVAGTALKAAGVSHHFAEPSCLAETLQAQ